MPNTLQMPAICQIAASFLLMLDESPPEICCDLSTFFGRYMKNEELKVSRPALVFYRYQRSMLIELTEIAPETY